MRQVKEKIEDVSSYGEFPEFITKDNTDVNGSIVCDLVPLSREEKLEKAKLASGPELTSLATMPVAPVSYSNRFAIMSQVSDAISKVPSVSDLKEELNNE